MTTGLKEVALASTRPELIPLYLTACTVEGKTDRTVQSYAETLRQFRCAGRELGLPEDPWQPSGRHMSISSWAGCGSVA